MSSRKEPLRVGEWCFLPDSCELRRGEEVRRLEPRAARALELLCAAEGELVSQEEFVARIWDGRALSENSVPVVIGQLRKALDDDAREQRLVETIAKRGYRLRSQAKAEAVRPRKGLWGWAAAIPLFLAVFAGGWILTASIAREKLVLEVGDVANVTGNNAYAPLARATSELIVTELGQRGYVLRRTGPADIRFESKLILWDGRPFLSVTGTDRQGIVRWTAMIEATEGKIPPGVDKALDGFAAEFSPVEGTERLAKGRSGG